MIAQAGRTPAWKRIGLAVLVGALATSALVATTASRADAAFAPLCQDTGMTPLSGETDSVFPPCDPNDLSFLPEIVDEPEHGVADVVDGYLTYASEFGYIGEDSFTLPRLRRQQLLQHGDRHGRRAGPHEQPADLRGAGATGGLCRTADGAVHGLRRT